jgi:hypothetical protein
LKALDLIGYNKNTFGLHSLRSGGATQAANNNVSVTFFNARAHWRSETPMTVMHRTAELLNYLFLKI